MHYAPGQKVVLNPNKSKPAWTNKEGGIDKIDGEKHVFFKGEADSKHKKSAVSSARGEAQGKAVDAINLLVATQFAEAWETLGVGKREDMERVREGLIATKNRMRIRGLRLIESYTEQVGVVKEVRDDRPVFSHREVRAYALYGLPYDKYVKMRDRLINQMKRDIRPNNRQKKLIRKVEKELDRLDKIESYTLDLPASK